MKAKQARKLYENSNSELAVIIHKIVFASLNGENEIYEDVSQQTEEMLINLGYIIQGRGISW